MRRSAFAKRLALQAIACLALSFAVFAAQRVPRRSTDTIAIMGLRQPVEILVDRWGVPHIYAKNEPDLFFAQGFNAARDRLFQIDLWRRRGLGHLSEVFGPAYIERLQKHPERMPFEFRKLDYTPAKWAPEDVVRIRTHGLTGNLNYEIARSKVVCAADLKSDRIRFRLQPEWQTQV